MLDFAVLEIIMDAFELVFIYCGYTVIFCLVVVVVMQLPCRCCGQFQRKLLQVHFCG